MTPQEAIDVLKKNYPSECFEDLREAVDEAIKALEKQIPMPPKMGYAFGEKIRTVLTFRGEKEKAETKTDCCPACGRPLGTSKYVQSQTGMRFGDTYCKRCGQAIDWG